MNDGEFYAWMKHHRTNFPGLTKWLDGLKSVKDGLTTRWHSTIAKYDLADAIRASDDMVRSPDKPTRYEDHIGNIAGRCDEIVRKRLAGRAFAKFGGGSVKCRWCNDSGKPSLFCHYERSRQVRSFLVFNVLAAVHSEEGEKNLYTFGGIACCCEAGDQFADPELRNPLPRFDPERHISVEGSPRWRKMERGDDGLTFWERTSERFERSSTAAFCGQIGPEGF